nr:capsid protein [Rat picobirnavirus]
MKEIEDTAFKSGSNPYDFYSQFPNFARDAATIPFANPLGAILTEKATETDYTVPGLMTIAFYPTVGVSHDYTSPMNRSSIRFYTYMRSIQKASAAYDHQDITMMVTALDNVIMFHDLLVRAYRVMNLWTPVNEYYPRALIAAMGLSYDSLKANLSDFRLYINNLGFQISQYAIPQDVKMISRHRWLVSGLYTDSEATRAQTYMFVPQGFWKYDNTVATGSQLTYVEWLGTIASPNIHTFEQVVTFGDGLMNAMSNEADFAIISGDMFSFFNGNVMILPEVQEKEIILPTYDKVVLSQIENLRIAGKWGQGYTPIISQDPSVNGGAIIFEPQMKARSFNADSGSNLSSYLNSRSSVKMNFHNDSPSAEQVMEASRFIYTAEVNNEESSNNGNTVIKSCGTELVSGLRIWHINPTTGSYRFYEMSSPLFLFQATSTVGAVAANFQSITDFYQFDWAPMIDVFVYQGSAGDHTFTYEGLLADVDVFSYIYDNYIENMNTAALYSLWNISQTGARDRANA